MARQSTQATEYLWGKKLTKSYLQRPRHKTIPIIFIALISKEQTAPVGLPWTFTFCTVENKTTTKKKDQHSLATLTGTPHLDFFQY